MDRYNGEIVKITTHRRAKYQLEFLLLQNKAIATFWSRGIRREKLLEAIRELRLPDAMTRTLEYLKSRGCKIAIVSDANELWIKEVG